MSDLGGILDTEPRSALKPVGWTLESYAIHAEALRMADQRFDDERDRRYTEVNIEKEKALKIKETADLAALSLARESQTYKEQQNDALRDKNLSESGVYATTASVNSAIEKLEQGVAASFEALMGKLEPFMNGSIQQKGADQGAQVTKANLYAAVGLLVGLIAVFNFLAAK